MELSALTAVSPIDGRYGDKADERLFTLMSTSLARARADD